MNKANAKLLEMGLNGRGHELALLMAVSRLDQDPDEVFAPSLTPESRRGLRLIALVSGAVAEDRFDPAGFSTAATRGHWARAFGSISGLAKEIGASEAETFSAMMGVVLVPTCYVDHFTLAAVSGIEISEVVCARMLRPPTTYSILCKSWAQRPTLAVLTRFAASGAAIDTRNPWLFDFKMGDGVERERLRRGGRMLLFISENDEAYGEVMRLVNRERWREAEDAAAGYFRQADAGPAELLEEVPALADFLATALIHVWAPEEAARACHAVN
jgi:hypothetical protein